MANALGIFLNKFSDWKFCPPSKNLWTVSISAHKDGTSTTGNTFSDLYANIIAVNKGFSNSVSSKWAVNAPDGANSFISSSTDSIIGLFLANEITFSTGSVNIENKGDKSSNALYGWMRGGMVQTGRKQDLEAKIKFYSTNWDINELLIDPWIAAIGQQGLIEIGDDNLNKGYYNIKADITICEYACSKPGEDTQSWVLRKTIVLKKAFPRARTNYTYNYNVPEFESPGPVSFIFDNYTITYK